MESRPGIPVSLIPVQSQTGPSMGGGNTCSGWIVSGLALARENPFIFWAWGNCIIQMRKYAPRLGLRIQEAFELHSKSSWLQG